MQTRPPVEATAEVSYNRSLSSDSFLLGLKAEIPAAKPGQFVMLGLPSDAAPLLRRPFSVLSHDPSRRLLEIHYSVEGRGTLVLSGATRGQKLNVLGPLGTHFLQFTVEENRQRGGGTLPLFSVLVAGGRGIAPLIFLAESMALSRRDSSNRVLFLAGARTAAELTLLDRIKATEVFISTDDGSAGKKGTVIRLLQSLERQSGPARKGAVSASSARSGAVLYGCGPAGMLRALHSYSVSSGLRCFVSLEARMACGIGVCQGCAVGVAGSRYALVCKDGPVFESGLIDWPRYEGA